MRELDSTANHADMYSNNYSAAENEKFTAEFGAITDAFKVQMQAGVPATDVSVQDLVRQHYEFCLQFWKPTRAAYKSLAMSYIMPSPYRDSYENVAAGLAKYHYDAIATWADQNLE